MNDDDMMSEVKQLSIKVGRILHQQGVLNEPPAHLLVALAVVLGASINGCMPDRHTRAIAVLKILKVVANHALDDDDDPVNDNKEGKPAS